MTGKPFRDGPAYITDASDDLYTSPDSALIADVTQIHLSNTSASPVNVSIYIGATGAEAGGTEIYDNSLGANETDDIFFPGGMPISSSDFIVGDAGTTNVVTATIIGTLRAA